MDFLYAEKEYRPLFTFSVGDVIAYNGEEELFFMVVEDIDEIHLDSKEDEKLIRVLCLNDGKWHTFSKNERFYIIDCTLVIKS